MLTIESMTLHDDQEDSAEYIYETAIVDSGTSYLLMPKLQRDKFKDKLNSIYNIRCDDIGMLICEKKFGEFPDLIFTMNGIEYIIP